MTKVRKKSREVKQKVLYIKNTKEDMMGSKRFKDQILAQILKTCEEVGKSKTQVVYGSGLNFKTIVPYLSTLKNNGLIEIIPGNDYPLYIITRKGKEVLSHLRALEELIPVYIYENGDKICEEGM